MKLTRAALLSFLIATISFLPSFLIPAQAITNAVSTNASGALSLSTASFNAYATTSPSGASTGSPLTMITSSGDQYPYIRNTGSIGITGFTMTITTSPVQSFTLKRCALNVAFKSPNTCVSGSSTTVSIVGGVVNLAIPANSWYALDFKPSKSTTPTFDISVSSSQIRSAIITNS